MDEGPPAPESLGFMPLTLDFGLALPDLSPAHRTVTIRFAPDDSALDARHDAALFLQHLSEFGDLSISLDASRLPEPDSFEPHRSYLGWTVTLRTDRPLNGVEEVFEFAKDACALEIEEAPAEAAPELAALPPLLEPAPLAAGNPEPVPERIEAPKAEAPKAETPKAAAAAATPPPERPPAS